MPLDTRGWLEAQLQRGGDEESLLRAITALCREDANHAWDILSQLDQFYRRQRISEPMFRAVKRRTEQLAFKIQTAKPVETRPQAGHPQVLRGRYELMEQLGSGAHGTVHKALDRLRADLAGDQQFVAIKLLHGSGPASSQQLMQLLRECHQAQSLSHPNIVRVYDVDRDRDQTFLVMELLQGMSLQNLLRELPGHKLPVAQALAVIRDVGAAVVYAHSRQVIHGDLQPQNVMIDFDSTLRVLNFGRLSDPADDLHALGCIAYELLAGAHPFGGHSAVDAQPLTLRPRRPGGLTRRQWRALRSALTWEQARRPASVAAWLDDLQLERAAPRLAPLSALLQAPAARRAGTARWALTGVAALVALTAVGVWNSRPAMRSVLAPREADAATAVSAPTPVTARTAPMPTVKPAPLLVAPQTDSSDAGISIAEVPLTAPVPPTIQLADERIVVAEDAAAAQITIRRSGDLHGDIDFSWWTEPGTARPGADYVADGPQSAQIPDGAESAQLFVPLIKDSTLLGDAEFYVQINAPSGATLGGTTRTTVHIMRGR